MKKPITFNDIDIVIALGNPGAEYVNTYHNAGALFVHFIKESSFATPLAIESLGVFMNTSVPAAQKQLKKNGVSPERMLLIHDDVDIPLGEYKLSFGGGAAGHHGVESVIDSLGTKDFWRLRIGIAKTFATPEGAVIKKKAMDYVLKPISTKDLELMHTAFEQASEALIG